MPFTIADRADVVNGPDAVANDNAGGFALHVVRTLRAERMLRLVVEVWAVHEPSAVRMPDGRSSDNRPSLV